MTRYFVQPMPPIAVVATGVAIAGGGAFYCFFYNMLGGMYENPLHAFAWSLANLVPWFVAFEMGKRFDCEPTRKPADRWKGITLVLILAALVSLALEVILGVIAFSTLPGDLPFQLVRRIPGAGIALCFLLARPLLDRLRGTGIDTGGEGPEDPCADLPLLPQQIDWVKAAGNYLEFRSAAGIVLRRMTMLEAERTLREHGFLRIHRSMLVNRSRIACVAEGKAIDQIRLLDGTCLRVGGAYRPIVARAVAE